MYMYKIEEIETKRSKKYIVIVIILALLFIAIATFGGVKLAEHVANKKQMAKKQNEMQAQKVQTEVQNQAKGKEQNENITQEPENKQVNNQKLTTEQINAINNIYNQKEKTAFLTFDDGPSNSVTPKILDTLKQENIKATFFVLGTMVKSNPNVLKREKEEGHYIANHGYSHVYKKVYENEKMPLEEYNKTNELIQKALDDENYMSNVFRFPGGSVGGYYDKIKTKAKQVFKENKVAYLDWNALTNDADGANTEEAIMKNLKSTCKNKNSVVILMHDAPNKDLTAKTLPQVISYLREQGYNFKSLYDIL